MVPESRFETALRSADPPAALRSLVAELSAHGHSKADISESLEKLLLRLRREGEAKEHEDIFLDVLDTLTGWCHPASQLLPGDEASPSP